MIHPLDPKSVRWAAMVDLSGIGNADPWTEARAIVYRVAGFECHQRIAALGDRIMHYRQAKGAR